MPLPNQYSVTTQGLSSGDDAPHGPYLLPPNYAPGEPYTIDILNVATSEDSGNQCEINDNGDFSLTWPTWPPDEGLPYACVTVQTTNMLSDDPAKRAILKQNFALFRQSLEDLEKQSCLAPGSAAVVANRVAAMLILRLDEILYYYYGFDPITGIELSPGMVLQVEAGAFQYVAPNGSSLPGAMLNAFVSAGQTHYSVSRNNLTDNLAFSTYLASLKPYEITPSGSPAANILDLNASGVSKRHWQLVYPTQFLSSTNISQDPGLQYNVALLGADTLVDLAIGVEAYTQAGTCASAPSSQCLYFTGRASVIPLIPIIFQQSPLLVPIGTTFHNLAQTFMVQSSGDLAKFFSGVNFYRYNVPGLLVPVPVGLQAGSLSITIDPLAYLAPVPDTGLTVWDVPFVLRDEASWTWTQPI